MSKIKKLLSTRKSQAISTFPILSTSLLIAMSAQAFVYDDDPNALLGTTHGGSALWDFCYQQPDETPLPADPRSLVTPGVNEGKAVSFNIYWKNCHVDTASTGEPPHPTTCGELRGYFSQGAGLLDTGGENVAALFTGGKYNSAEAFGGISVFSAKAYNRLWQRWEGFDARPANFDELVAERYGSGFAGGKNPYPLPGEDPNTTNGGSGNLPEMFTQLRDSDGSWSGKIGVTCFSCHSGKVGNQGDAEGLGVQYGGSNSTADLNLFLRDMRPLGYTASLVTPLNLTQTRGTNNASAVNIAFLFPQEGLPSLGGIFGIATSGSTGGVDSPNVWNMGHRPAKFMDGLFAMDASIVDAVFYSPFAGLFGSFTFNLGDKGQDWMRNHGFKLNTWVEAQKAPPYPFEVNEDLAKAGAVLFHNMNLWDEARNNPVRKPATGNGSCASCHGAYSPRFVNDANFLEDPRLEGMAAYVAPMDIIRTDDARLQANNELMQKAGARNFFGYPSTKGTENDCGPQGQKRLRGDRPKGYLAPPLYGIWASAPYLHNGSVPNLWELLKPSERKPIWRRVSSPVPEGSPAETVMGFDTDVFRAYDQEKMGWYYDEIPCEEFPPTVRPGRNCTVGNPNDVPAAQKRLNWFSRNVVGMWNLLYPAISTTEEIQNRKIYNTHLYGQGNQGHSFNSVLSDAERKAILEYLKTL